LLVIISDGRGNLPLEASHLGWVRPPVGRKGIEDALLVAERIRCLDRVKTVVLNPQPKLYQELPLNLAKALGAVPVFIPSLDMMEVE
jgi:magnesium chelatase subunit D